MNKIVAVRKDTDGVIYAVKLDDGREMSMYDAIGLASKHEIEGVLVGHSKFGDPYLRGVGDGDAKNNLDNLPIF